MVSTGLVVWLTELIENRAAGSSNTDKLTGLRINIFCLSLDECPSRLRRREVAVVISCFIAGAGIGIVKCSLAWVYATALVVVFSFVVPVVLAITILFVIRA